MNVSVSNVRRQRIKELNSLQSKINGLKPVLADLKTNVVKLKFFAVSYYRRIYVCALETAAFFPWSFGIVSNEFYQRNRHQRFFADPFPKFSARSHRSIYLMKETSWKLGLSLRMLQSMLWLLNRIFLCLLILLTGTISLIGIISLLWERPQRSRSFSTPLKLFYMRSPFLRPKLRVDTHLYASFFTYFLNER